MSDKFLQFHVIETEYRGFRFRSRTEARWAVFMDALGVPFEYEPNAYTLGGLNYLPDFWLPQTNQFLEIKPTKPSEEESEKAARLAKFTGFDVLILIGAPGGPVESAGYEYLQGQAEIYSWIKTPGGVIDWDTGMNDPNATESAGWDAPYIWCECEKCGRCEMQFDGRAERIGCKCEKSGRYNYDSPRLVAAYNRAKMFRFEPGARNP